MPRESIRRTVANAWSESINGLSGRLCVELENLKPGLRHAIYLELKNHSLNPITVINQPRVHAELFDVTGKPVSTSGFPISGPIHKPQWAVIPRDAYIGLRLDTQIVGMPTREYGMILIAVGEKSWGLRPGKYTLEIAAVFKYEENGPKNQWIGQFDLPQFEIVVTTEMLAIQ
ncbi:hypothetical protein [Nitrosovibrio tenuis]|uniref:Uncharacterized protein n=1 Tax=Nitrosovibrio tenuis TaxID=1233 RepID=A0A1H7MMG5_9PROT|nr:hypothetical protein [Nitrosovibrio tenuis]SEL12334.1 hypothetical protein SAMN05216387_105139 [Nitrosovibrio tenuis]